MDYRLENDIYIITIHEVISNDLAVEMRKQVVALIQELQPQGLVLTLLAEEISSLGIGCVIAIHRDMRGFNVKFSMNLTPSLHEQFIRNRMNRVIAIFTDEDEAIQNSRP